MFDDGIETKDKLNITASCNVGDEDRRSIQITKDSEGFIGDWLREFRNVLWAMGFDFVGDIVAYSQDGGTEYTMDGVSTDGGSI